MYILMFEGFEPKFGTCCRLAPRARAIEQANMNREWRSIVKGSVSVQ
jgi:hypothetical protein